MAVVKRRCRFAKLYTNGVSIDDVQRLLSESEIKERLKRLDGWGREGKFITKAFEFGTFMEGISFINTFEGWGVGNGGFLQGEIIHTTDGGMTWSYQVQDSMFPLRRVAMVDGTHGWAVGAAGTIWKYYGTLMLGDLNLDGQITETDIVLVLNKVFLDAPVPAPTEAGDVNCDNLFTAADVVLLLYRTFVGTPFPCNK